MEENLVLNKMKKNCGNWSQFGRIVDYVVKKCSIHLRSKGKGQELRKTLFVLLKHIGKIEKERKKSRQARKEYLEHHHLLGRQTEREKGLRLKFIGSRKRNPR